MDRTSGARWAVVLAGGDGTRLRPYVTRRFGDDRPKQYCAFAGGRTMLQETVDRAARLATAERTVTVVAAWHQRWASEQLAGHPGTIVTQTMNCETGPGVFLPLCWVRARDPHAIVYILPSDHYVRPDDRFVAAVAAAGNVAAEQRDRLVLTGVVPDGPEPEYGYIEPGAATSTGWRASSRSRPPPRRPPRSAAARCGTPW
jgi:mannose-1-phosphate guanylyltransferase